MERRIIKSGNSRKKVFFCSGRKIIKSDHSPKKDFTVHTSKSSIHSNLNFSSHVSQSEQDMEYNHMTLDPGL